MAVYGKSAPEDQQLDTPPEFMPDDNDTPPDIHALTADDEDIERPEPEPGTPVTLPPRAVSREEPNLDPANEVAVVEDLNTAIALDDKFDVTKSGESWPYDQLHFKGDLLGIRLPQRQALAAFSLASSKYVSLGVKNDLTGLFIARHLSPESYGRVFSRLMDPDENDYDVDTVGELFNEIVTASIDADKAEGGDKPR